MSYYFLFFAYFYAKTYYLSFSDLGFESRKVFFSKLIVDIFPLGSGSVDLHILMDPDPGSKNLADPTEPDPKHAAVLIVV